MDPFATLNAAANIIQFVGYTRDVYLQIREIRMSATGITKQDADNIWSISELQGMVDKIHDGIVPLEHSSTDAERKIRDLGRRCQELSKTIYEDIENKSARAHRNVFSAPKVVFMMKWKTSEVDDKLTQLKDIQDVLFKSLIIHISTQQNGLGRAMMRLMEQNRKLEIERGHDLTELKEEILKAISPMKTLRSAKASDTEMNVKLGEIKTMLETWSERASSFQKEQAIISSLYFDGMLHRRDEIPHAYTQTFNWIYEERLRVKDWLTSEEEIVYWISGDPGSGKSTLTKHLSNDMKIHKELERWASPRKLIKAAFYFWISGTRLQKSQEGLLRSILFEVFRQSPSIVATACPSRWSRESQQPWTKLELMETIQSLSSENSATRFCFFIDGLDEYQGGRANLCGSETASHVTDIIDVIKAFSKLPYMKLCISSRPWHAFEEAFRSYHKLYVNEENREDILLYVKQKFEDSTADTRMLKSEDGPQLRKIIDEIAQISRGVFLWVALVVESLLRGLTNRDRIAELRERLETTPRTLNAFFDRMLESVEDIYHEQAAQILQVALYADEPMNLAVYAYIGDSNHDALTTPTRPWTIAECQSLAETTATRIKVRCPDLLKITIAAQANYFPQVDFLHRTARDFLSIDDTQNRLQSRLKIGFHPGSTLCDGLLTQLKGYNTDDGADGLHALSPIFYYAKRVEEDVAKPQKKFMDEVLSVLKRQGWGETQKLPILGSLSSLTSNSTSKPHCRTPLGMSIMTRGRYYPVHLV